MCMDLAQQKRKSARPYGLNFFFRDFVVGLLVLLSVHTSCCAFSWTALRAEGESTTCRWITGRFAFDTQIDLWLMW